MAVRSIGVAGADDVFVCLHVEHAGFLGAGGHRQVEPIRRIEAGIQERDGDSTAVGLASPEIHFVVGGHKGWQAIP